MMVSIQESFPQDLVLVNLLDAAAKFPEKETIIHDIHGFEKTYPQLLGDVVETLKTLRAQIPASSWTELGILQPHSNYVAFLTGSGYEFLVAFFAIRAIGGVCVPLASGILPEEGQYFMNKAKTSYLLFGRDSADRAKAVSVYMETHKDVSLLLLPISTNAEPIPTTSIRVDDALEMNPNEPGLVLFTSGTTGFPKGVVLSRLCLANTRPVQPGSAAVNFRPGNWMGGASSTIGPVISAQKLYTLGSKGSPETVLDLFKSHHITNITFSPEVLRSIRDLLTNGSGLLSAEDRDRCACYFKGLSSIRYSTSSMEPSLKEFWTDLTGLPFISFYGATELGGGATIGSSPTQDTIGAPGPGVEVKLSEGDHGEILIKSPAAFLRYLDDEELTKAAFDEEGYYKTGDLGKLKDGEYIFAGRANSDYIFFNLLRISTMAVEQALTNLPYISEACVLGVPDRDVKQLCGAVVRLHRTEKSPEKVDLCRIRSDIGDALAPYMLPVLLRVLQDGEELPRTVSGKPIKKKILEDYFGTEDWFPSKNIPKGVDAYLVKNAESAAIPWAWAGLQRAA